ncbi:DUF6629 family protein [Kitasatospora sp. NPDC087314]|uniref:DUF6629 family protein n=1 Tax=Kitasatospora sp. NPDC087314 TaxID=3364068 RepID=UPI003815DA94
MCWSDQADAVAGGVVAGVGVLCLVRARRAGRPRRLILAALPLVLGVHQLIEALVWLGTDRELPAALADAARTAWAVIALLWRLAFVSTWCALAAAVSRLLLYWSGRPPERRAERRPVVVGGR